MSRFVISGTTCITRIPGKDEIAEFFIHAPEVGYKAWGAAGPLFWTPGLVRWANIDLIKNRAAQAGLEICTEVYGPAFPNDSIAEIDALPISRSNLVAGSHRSGTRLEKQIRERIRVGQPS